MQAGPKLPLQTQWGMPMLRPLDLGLTALSMPWAATPVRPPDLTTEHSFFETQILKPSPSGLVAGPSFWPCTILHMLLSWNLSGYIVIKFVCFFSKTP